MVDRDWDWGWQGQGQNGLDEVGALKLRVVYNVYNVVGNVGHVKFKVQAAHGAAIEVKAPCQHSHASVRTYTHTQSHEFRGMIPGSCNIFGMFT